MPVQGTYSYMAPEQIRGQAVDERADIYSFGCMVYELITGKLPFTATSPAELLNKHLKTKPTQHQRAQQERARRLRRPRAPHAGEGAQGSARLAQGVHAHAEGGPRLPDQTAEAAAEGEAKDEDD